MTELISFLFNKISVYEILNNFLPGLLFYVILKYFIGYDIFVGNDFENVFICYFIGMFISRAGSLWLEKILKCSHFLRFADYKDFVKAEKEDDSKKITLLSDINNSYRSYTTVFLISLIIQIVTIIVNSAYDKADFLIFVILLVLFLLFLFSYRKQTTIVRKRVEIILTSNN